ncbi:MAG TPA: hypothetical protein HPP94_03900 [Desulfuromonadales bacterium]|nr:hypothetical protein [Desulfuromonadales bacterium]
MLIQVNYPDNRYDYVKEFILDVLIEKHKIKRFRRSSGWVTLGVNPVRAIRRSCSGSGRMREDVR